MRSGCCRPSVVAGPEARMWIDILDEPLPTVRVLDEMKAGPDGAVVVFDGIVRNNTRGRETLYLDYEAYREMALGQMRTLAAEAVAKFGVRDVAMLHRLGRLHIGETSVLIVVASAHRGAAFDACRWLIDTLKKQVPIWKKETFIDGAVWADGEAFPAPVALHRDATRNGGWRHSPHRWRCTGARSDARNGGWRGIPRTGGAAPRAPRSRCLLRRFIRVSCLGFLD